MIRLKKLFITVGVVVLLVVGGWRFCQRPSTVAYQGRSMDQWLKILYSGDMNSSSESLRACKIYMKEPDHYAFEVPISFDRMVQNGFFDKNGKLCLWIDYRYVSCHDWVRSTNGNCLMIWDVAAIPSGLHQIHLEFSLFSDSSKWHTLRAIGPTGQITLPGIIHSNINL